MTESRYEPEHELEKLETPEEYGLDEKEAELIRKAYRRCVRDGQTDSTLYSLIYNLRVFAKRCDVPLYEATLEDLNSTLDLMASGEHPDVKDDGITVQNFQIKLRVFYRIHDQFGIDNRDIEINHSTGRELSADDLLYREEVDALLDACWNNPRDKALIALFLATGQRINAIRTLRYKDVTVSNGTMEIRLNEEEGGLKGAKGAKPLLWAKHYVKPWYDSHPFSDDPEAAFFCGVKEGIGGNSAEFLSHKSIWRIINRRAEKAELDKDVYPHLLRHTAITRMVLEGLSEQQIKDLVGWHADSSQFETYVTLKNELATDSVRKKLGLPTSGEDNPAHRLGRPTFAKCMDCGEELPDNAEHCNRCGAVLTHVEYLEGDHEPEKPEPTEMLDEMEKDDLAELAQELTKKLNELD